jgi:hypothetical protein
LGGEAGKDLSALGRGLQGLRLCYFWRIWYTGQKEVKRLQAVFANSPFDKPYWLFMLRFLFLPPRCFEKRLICLHG